MEIMRAEQLFRSYTESAGAAEDNPQDYRVLKGINLTVQEGEFVGIMGKSGCGKTTLLRTLGMIDRPTKGNIYFKGVDTEQLWTDELSDIRRRDMGFVFQDFYLMDSLSVRENIMLPMILDKAETKKCLESAEKLASQFEITHLLDKKPYELSGGEKQRVAICRALNNDPQLIFADEPTGNLDSKSGKIVVDVLESINRKMGKTIIMVTHDPKVASYCSRIILLRDGMILEELASRGGREEFYQHILSKMSEL